MALSYMTLTNISRGSLNVSAVTDPLFSRDEYLHLKTILPLKHKHGQTHTVVQERSYSDKMKKKYLRNMMMMMMMMSCWQSSLLVKRNFFKTKERNEKELDTTLMGREKKQQRNRCVFVCCSDFLQRFCFSFLDFLPRTRRECRVTCRVV